jgi:hypothetical protein
MSRKGCRTVNERLQELQEVWLKDDRMLSMTEMHELVGLQLDALDRITEVERVEEKKEAMEKLGQRTRNGLLILLDEEVVALRKRVAKLESQSGNHAGGRT